MLRTINPSDVAGNDGLCGNVLPPCTGNQVSDSRHKGLHMRHVIAGWVIGMSVLLAVLLAAFAEKALYDRWYTNGGCFEERFEMGKEYGYTLKVDEKSDIYSYGVVLMELITGKRPVEPEYGASVDIVEWVRRKVRDSKPLTEVVDPNVGNCKHVEEEMLLVLRIALICTARLPKDRPSMRDVVSMLEEARPRRKSSSNTNNVD
ncbi:hypothetical protein L6452_14062 [Arctium lappa]|uniref:Uncharacterized protein n=1 Tax=Arctium lappa TaxID=4217 RepID=A0ACB9CK23_ARCLA|nr:hypothetical protein L6452_14062 [Arctium lappa]